jgi:signal transduction histidine kinase
MGQDLRAWPMLALLLAVVMVGIGCVLWFMNEAMRNEGVAARERLTDAYRGHLALVQRQAEERWQTWRTQLDATIPAAEHFDRLARSGIVDSAICFAPDGEMTYPQNSVSVPDSDAVAGEAIQQELRERATRGRANEVIEFVIEKFRDANGALVTRNGRLVALSAELMALDLLAGKNDGRVELIAARLRSRLLDYSGPARSSQRVFVMRELMRLVPGQEFPTFAAEELAARYLDAHAKPSRHPELQPTELRDVWSVASPSGLVLGLLTTPRLQTLLMEITREPSLPPGVKVTAVPPNQDPKGEGLLVTSTLSAQMPGWRLALGLDERAQRGMSGGGQVSRYLLIGSVVIAAMIVLALVAGRRLGREVQLARLKNDLVANVSHELKTPLTSMRALVETLLEAEQLDDRRTREYLQLMAAENARLSRMIENFLTFSRLERNKLAFDFAPVRPTRVVEDAVAALGARAQAPGCNLSVRVAADLPEIRGNSDALVTALLNLLENAWKYTGEEKQIVLRAEAQDGAVCFAVQDNGLGLSRADRRAVFDRFHQADIRLSRDGSGCGLGLSIVRSIALAHEGQIQVASELGVGSTFTMTIPAMGRRAA